MDLFESYLKTGKEFKQCPNSGVVLLLGVGVEVVIRQT